MMTPTPPVPYIIMYSLVILRDAMMCHDKYSSCGICVNCIVTDPNIHGTRRAVSQENSLVGVVLSYNTEYIIMHMCHIYYL